MATRKDTCWDVADKVGMAASTRIMLLYGLAGTGKTYTGYRVSQALKRPLYSVTLTEDTLASELRGHWIPNAGADGAWTWHYGPFIEAWRKGGVLVINEVDHAGGDALDLCMATLDDPESARITLPSGEEVRPKEKFRAIATMNGEPEDLPMALADRFTVRVNITHPHPDAVAALPEDLRPLAKLVSDPNPERRVGMRAIRAFGQLRSEVGESFAAKACFHDRAQELLDASKVAAMQRSAAGKA